MLTAAKLDRLNPERLRAMEHRLSKLRSTLGAGKPYPHGRVAYTQAQVDALLSDLARARALLAVEISLIDADTRA